jgi:2-enoate reductase
MKSDYNVLFEPMKIGQAELKNRISMAAMGTSGMVTPKGAFSKEAIDYYVERAKGGVGLITTGTVYVENEIEKVKDGAMPCATVNKKDFTETASVLCEKVHAYDTKIFVQLTAGFGRVLSLGIQDGEYISSSPISCFWDDNIICRPLERNEIEKIVEKTAEAALVCKEAGFDGIEIHAVHEGYLLDQFALSLYNKRTDEYGGDLRGRLKFACDIVKRIKENCGENYPVVMRYSLKSCIKDVKKGGLPGEDYIELGRDIEEGIEAAKILEEAGYDAFNVDAGTYDSWYWSHPPMYFKKGMYLEFSEILKKELNVPILVAGRMEDPDLASKSIIEKKADGIVIGRGLLADPDLPKKILTNQLKSIRPCIGCHNGCMGRLIKALPMSCAVNPLVGREKSYQLNPIVIKKRVCVVGGGVAGMEASRVLAERGHEVVLHEKTDRLGGCLIPGGMPEFKEDDRKLLAWYENELDRLPIEIKMKHEVDSMYLKNDDSDVVLIVTGAIPNMLKMPKNNNIDIYSAEEVLKGKEIGQNVIIVGGGLVGCELALHLSMKGKNIEIIELEPEILGGGRALQIMNRNMLSDLLDFKKVSIHTSTSLKSAVDGYATIVKSGEDFKIPCDTIVSSIGYKTNRKLYENTRFIGKETYLIGDARKVQNIMYAIWDAYEVANNI